MSNTATAHFREQLDDALLRLQLQAELERYPLPESWRPKGIVENLVNSAAMLLPSLTPEDQRLERLIIDLYDARHLAIDELIRELDRLREAVGDTGLPVPAPCKSRG